MPDATDTLTRPRGNDALTDSPAPEKAPGYLGLSLTQILGGALAAVSAAALGARLGLAGTLTGAAIGSVVSAVAAAAYTQSLRHTREIIRSRAFTTVTGERSVAVVADSPVEQPPRPTRERDRSLVRRVALGAAALFAAVLLLITGIELGMGRALDGQSGTTVRQVVEKAGTGKAGAGKPTGPATSPTSDAPATSDSPSDSPTGQTPSPSTDTPTTSTDTPTTSTDTPTTSTDAPSTPSDPATSPVGPEPSGDVTTPAVQGGLDPTADPTPATP